METRMRTLLPGRHFQIVFILRRPADRQRKEWNCFIILVGNVHRHGIFLRAHLLYLNVHREVLLALCDRMHAHCPRIVAGSLGLDAIFCYRVDQYLSIAVEIKIVLRYGDH